MTRFLSYDRQDPNPAADVVDILLAVQMERMRVEEALAARDNVVAHLEDVHTSVRQKAATILRLEQELEVFKRTSTPGNTLPSDFEGDSKPGTPQSDPSQAAFEELEDTQVGAMIYFVAQISLKRSKQ